MINMNTGRTWANAPSGVRDARQLAWLGVVISGLLVIVVLGMIMSGGLHAGAGNSIALVVYALFFPFYIWLLIGLKRGTRAAYYVQMIISLIGLAGFPLGTLINAYILYKWFRPETRAWFGA